LPELKKDHKNKWEQDKEDERLWGVITEPKVRFSDIVLELYLVLTIIEVWHWTTSHAYPDATWQRALGSHNPTG